MDLSQLLPDHFQLIDHAIGETAIQISLIATQTVGRCPACQLPTNKVHSFYHRTLTDLPICGKAVSLRIHLRKFFCRNDQCNRKIFAQTASDYFFPYARRLNRAQRPLQAIALLTGARPGARLCELTGQPVSHSTLLRISRRTPVQNQPTPVRLGVDDFAFRKGRRYGTILIDLDRHQPFDVLPDREGKTLEDWFRDHPGVELVTRDRSSVYANAITTACPSAVQVADRWHLLANLSDAVERFLDTQRTNINQSMSATLLKEEKPITPQQLTEDQLPPFITWETDISNLMSTAKLDCTSKGYATFQKVKQLQAEGHGMRAIARHLGIARNTVRRYWKQDTFVPRMVMKRSNLYLYEGYLRRRWLQGQTCVKDLLTEIKSFGYNGSYTILANFLSTYPRLEIASVLPPARKGSNFSSRRISRLLNKSPTDWSTDEQAFLTHLLKEHTSIREVYELSEQFRQLMKQKSAEGLAKWCEDAEKVSAYTGFVRGLRQDYAAVEQAFVSEWSNGQTEGQVNRLKMIKRQGYGRASFDLLRRRVLFRNCTPHRN
ncbi:ISL3 family transposase [Spirosoma migulaei]